MNRLLLIVGGLLVGILAALFIVPVFVDWNRYRGTFEEEASKLLGRDVRVAGSVNLRLLPTPYIRFEKVRISDPRGNVGEPLFRADDFTVWLAVGPLFSGTVEASRIELRKPVLTLVLDEKGGGNWSDFAAPRNEPRFMPSSVVLNGVRLTDGAIGIYGPGGVERTRIERIDGELTAASLQGPYKVAATLTHRGRQREVRFSTTEPDSDGVIRVKGGIRVPDSGATFTLDGQIHEVMQRPRLEGELTARLPLPRQNAGDAEMAFDVRSALQADTSGLALSDIALSFEQDGRPQLASGRARMSWSQQDETELVLASRWLDLDRIAGLEPRATPLAVLARIVGNVGGALSGEGRTRMHFDLDQATLGGEVVTGLEAEFARRDGVLSLQALNAALPGGSQIEASGTLAPDAGETLFDGKVLIRGANLARTLSWGARGAELPQLGRDGSFAASGRVKLGREAYAVSGMSFQLGGSTLTGDVSWSGGAARKLVLSLDGDALDASPFVPDGAGPVASLKSLAHRFAVLPATATGSDATKPPELTARLRLAQLTLGRHAYTDVVADVAYVGGNLKISGLRLGSAEGWHLDVSGDIAGLLRAGAKGRVSGYAAADTAQALTAILTEFELPATALPTPDHARALAPLRLAVRLGVGEKGPEVYDLQLDGRIDASRLAGTVVLDRKGASWREHVADVALATDHPTLAELLAQWHPAIAPSLQRPVDGRRTAATAPARVGLRAFGTAKDGLSTLLSVESSGLAAELRGRIAVDEAAKVQMTSDIRLAVDDIGRTLAMAGWKPRAEFAGTRASGTILATLSGSKWTVEPRDLALGADRLSGRLDIDTGHTEPRIAGRLAIGRLSVPLALALITDGLPSDPRGGALPSGRRLVWPDGTFDFGVLDKFDVKVAIDAAQLELAPGILTGKSKLEFGSKAARLDVRIVDAEALGGRLLASFQLERAASGARVAGNVTLAGARLEALTSGAATPSSGIASVKLGVEGQGLTLQSLVAALKGTGEVTLQKSHLRGISPSAPRKASAAILALRGELPTGEIQRQLEAALAAGETVTAAARLPLEVIDGVVRVGTLKVAVEDGRVTGTTLLDLGALYLDSEWRIEPAPETAAVSPSLRQALPAVSVVYTGPVGRLSAIERRLQSEAFERELTVRKYERDVDQLEAVRREDERRAREEAVRRAREEAERLQKLEAERVRGNEPASPPLQGVAPIPPAQLPRPAKPEQPLQSGELVPPPPTQPQAGGTGQLASPLANPPPVGSTDLNREAASPPLPSSGPQDAAARPSAPVLQKRSPPPRMPRRDPFLDLGRNGG